VETWEALKSRRNVREFSRTPVSEDDLSKILEAGRLAPSAKNWQPWDFVLVTDRNQLSDLTVVW
jgi:nitroreductase